MGIFDKKEKQPTVKELEKELEKAKVAEEELIKHQEMKDQQEESEDIELENYEESGKEETPEISFIEMLNELIDKRVTEILNSYNVDGEETKDDGKQEDDFIESE